MKLTQLISPTLLCLSALASPLAGANCDINQLSLQINQIEKQQGNFFVAIHDSAGTYMTKDADVFMESVLPVTRLGAQTLQICDVPAGTYAVAVYQDVNDNGKLDSNFIRIPKEPYGFSNNIEKLTHLPLRKPALNLTAQAALVLTLSSLIALISWRREGENRGSQKD